MKIFQIIVKKEKQKIFVVATVFKHVGYSEKPLYKMVSEPSCPYNFYHINQSETCFYQIRDLI